MAKSIAAARAAGFRTVARAFRGYELTARRPIRFEDDLLPYLLSNPVADVFRLEKGAAVIGTTGARQWRNDALWLGRMCICLS
jgi:hypothetical protein